MTRGTNENIELLRSFFYKRQACTCGHLKSAHSDGLDDDPTRLCAMCDECEGFEPKAPEGQDEDG